jgi:hypothetical protein
MSKSSKIVEVMTQGSRDLISVIIIITSSSSSLLSLALLSSSRLDVDNDDAVLQDEERARAGTSRGIPAYLPPWGPRSRRPLALGVREAARLRLLTDHLGLWLELGLLTPRLVLVSVLPSSHRFPGCGSTRLPLVLTQAQAQAGCLPITIMIMISAEPANCILCISPRPLSSDSGKLPWRVAFAVSLL